MSKTTKPRCPDCGARLKKSARFCATCGAVKGSMGKAFNAEPDPAVREYLWNQAYEGGFIAKVASPAVYK